MIIPDTNFRFWFLALMGVVGLLAACTAAVQPDGRNDEDAPPAEEPAAEGGEGAADEPPGPGLVPPSGTVNLQDLTPLPREGENVVQPAPGLPDPSARVVQLAKQDLAAATGRDVAGITLVAVEQVDWPDSSLGCPREGEMYLQVITPGFRITLAAGVVQYTYHSDMGTRMVPCPVE